MFFLKKFKTPVPRVPGIRLGGNDLNPYRYILLYKIDNYVFPVHLYGEYYVAKVDLMAYREQHHRFNLHYAERTWNVAVSPAVRVRAYNQILLEMEQK